MVKVDPQKLVDDPNYKPDATGPNSTDPDIGDEMELDPPSTESVGQSPVTGEPAEVDED